MDVILQFIGLSFLFLGLLLLVWPHYEDEFSFARTLRFLGAFGLSHGFIEWMELWRELHEGIPLFDTIKPFILLLSYLFLFEFGRRLTRSNLSPAFLSSLPGQLLAPWIYIMVFGAVGYGTAFSHHSLSNFITLSQYVYGFSAAVLTGIGFFIYWDRFVKAKLVTANRRPVKIAFYVLALSFISYGVLGGLFTPSEEWFPDTRLKQDLFTTLIAFPVQSIRTLSVVLAALSLLYILRIFYFVSHKDSSDPSASPTPDKRSLDDADLRYKTLLRAANDGIHVLNIDGDLVEVNDVFCQMLGYTRDELLGMNVNQWDAQFSPEELKRGMPEIINKTRLAQA